MDFAVSKPKSNISREEIAALLASIGPPGEKRQEKYEAVKALKQANFQGFKLEDSLASYEAW